MNLTDLTEELATRAQTPAPSPAVARLQGVRHRIRVRRRRQVAAATGLTAVCVATALLVPGLFGPSTAANLPADTDRSRPNPTSGPLHFAADLGQDPLIAAAVSRPGEAELTLSFTPTDTNISVSSFCRLEGVSFSDRADAIAETTLNGHGVTSGDCNENGAPNVNVISKGDDIKVNRAGWAADGVVAGQENILRVHVTLKNGMTKLPDDLRLGVGVYELSGSRVVSQGVTLKKQINMGAHRYSLEKYVTKKASATTRSLSMTTSDHTNIGLIVAGNPNDTSDSGGNFHLFVDGQEGSSSTGGGTVSEALDDTDGHTFEVRLDPGLAGTMVLAYYVDIG